MAEAQKKQAIEATDDGAAAQMSEAEVAALSDDHTHCLVCYSELTVRGKTPCDHDDICGACHLRLRHLHNDKKCPICKASNDLIIVDGEHQKKFSDYPMWGNEIGAGFIHREDVGMFFETQYYNEDILPMFSYDCSECEFKSQDNAPNKKNTPLRLLQDHLRTNHRMALCQLCIDHKRDFVSQLPRFSPSQLQQHLRHGDGPTSGFSGHPICVFCKPKRFYDLSFLHQHLHKDHYKCHVCEKAGIDNQFFKNYSSLEKHFDQQHFLCRDVQCLGARFVVFTNEIDFRGHELSVHGGTSTGSTKINLEFRTRRRGYDGSGVEEQQTAPSDSDFNYGLEGQSFVPDALPTSNNAGKVQLHPLHIQRTEELRQQAAVIRGQQDVVSEEDSFPTLQAAAAASTSAPLVMGWASGVTSQRLNTRKKQAGKVTAEDFPSLPVAPTPAQANARSKAMRPGVGAARRQFAVMNTSASKQQPSWGTGGAISAPAPVGRTSNFLTPSPMVGSVNRQSNLAADNFPSLGPSPTARAPYTAANALARKSNQRSSAPSMNSAADFPSMATSTTNRQQKSARNRVIGDSKPPSQQAMSNVLQANLMSSTATATVEEMKASLGPNKFKQLKRLTKEFASGNISAEGYVDQSAALFDQGYGDSDFWSFLPSLLDSCPNEDSAEHAMIYLTSLKRQQFGAASRSTPAVAAAPAAANWGGSSRNMNVARQPVYTTAKARPLTQPVLGRPIVVASKKKNSWGGSGTANIVRVQPTPGSMRVAAANQAPQGGSATKFMAKEQKKQAAAKAQQPKANGKKNKKKERDDLRALAFGK